MLKVVINKEYKEIIKSFLADLPHMFDSEGIALEEARNTIKVFDYKGLKINVKSFQVPHILNRFVYATFRDSKAKRSYRYAQKLLEKGINTPAPLAFVEKKKGMLLAESLYVSIHEIFDNEMRVLYSGTVEEHKELILQFAQFTASLHNYGILHLDYSSGNILYKLKDGKYEFYLVDLNRMNFDTAVDINAACHNFRRLWGSDDVISFFAKEYAKARGFDEAEAIEKTLNYRHQFWKTYRRKYPNASYCQQA